MAFEIGTVTIRPTAATKGQTLWKQPTALNHDVRYMVCMAGPLAQQRHDESMGIQGYEHDGSFYWMEECSPPGCSDDQQKAHESLEKLVWLDRQVRVSMCAAGMKLASDEVRDQQVKVEHILRVQGFVADNWTVIVAVAKRLIEKVTISGVDVESLIERDLQRHVVPEEVQSDYEEAVPSP